MLIDESRLQKVAYSSRLADKLKFERTGLNLNRLRKRMLSSKELGENGIFFEGKPVHTVWMERDLEDAIDAFKIERSESDVRERFEEDRRWDRITTASISVACAMAVSYLADFFELDGSARLPVMMCTLAVCVGTIVKSLKRYNRTFDAYAGMLGQSLSELREDIFGAGERKGVQNQ